MRRLNDSTDRGERSPVKKELIRDYNGRLEQSLQQGRGIRVVTWAGRARKHDFTFFKCFYQECPPQYSVTVQPGCEGCNGGIF